MGHHDTFVKALLSDRSCAVEYLRSALPRSLVAAMDWSAFDEVPGSFADTALQLRHTDKLFTVRLRNRDAYIFVLCEHQSTPDAWMPRRLYSYCDRIWEHWTAQQSPADARTKKLPAIVPLVFHQGETQWTGPRRLRELYDLEGEEWEWFGDVVPDLGFFIDDLGAKSVTELDRPELSGSMQLALVVLWAIRHDAPGGFVSLLDRYSAYLDTVQPTRRELELLRTMVEYMLREREEPVEVLVEPIRKRLSATNAEDVMTAAQRLIQEGEDRGRDLGVKEGRDLGVKEGRKLGLAKALVAVLDARGLSVSEPVRTRLESCTAEQLESLMPRALSCPTPESLFHDA